MAATREFIGRLSDAWRLWLWHGSREVARGGLRSRLSPAAAITSKMPLFRLSSETSRVPPPMSYTITVCTWDRVCNPYAIAAAVGSWMQRSTSKPARIAASRVA